MIRFSFGDILRELDLTFKKPYQIIQLIGRYITRKLNARLFRCLKKQEYSIDVEYKNL